VLPHSRLTTSPGKISTLKTGAAEECVTLILKIACNKTKKRGKTPYFLKKTATLIFLLQDNKFLGILL
jgi:hypothetical protein